MVWERMGEVLGPEPPRVERKGMEGWVGGMMERRVWQVTGFCPHSVYSARSRPHVLGYWEAAGQAPGM